MISKFKKSQIKPMCIKQRSKYDSDAGAYQLIIMWFRGLMKPRVCEQESYKAKKTGLTKSLINK